MFRYFVYKYVCVFYFLQYFLADGFPIWDECSVLYNGGMVLHGHLDSRAMINTSNELDNAFRESGVKRQSFYTHWGSVTSFVWKLSQLFMEYIYQRGVKQNIGCLKALSGAITLVWLMKLKLTGPDRLAPCLVYYAIRWRV